jgi:DNA-binding transcriptional regulator LsrR (DeoR family)
MRIHGVYFRLMARLNISLPDDIYELANKWRGSMNLSDVCSKALRDEFMAAETAKSTYSLHEVFRPPSKLERQLKRKYALAEVLTCEATSDEPASRDSLGEAAAAYLDRMLCDDSRIAIGGGRQMWCLVRNLKPHNLRVTITAMGIQHNDPQALHAHPNTLMTLLWLLYGSRARAHLVGAKAFDEVWGGLGPDAEHVNNFVIASCAGFDMESPLVDLLGTDTGRELVARGVRGEFAYTFMDGTGRDIPDVEFPTRAHSVFGSEQLRVLSKRRDTRVILVAGGEAKRRVAKQALESGLCNVLITDLESGNFLNET